MAVTNLEEAETSDLSLRSNDTLGDRHIWSRLWFPHFASCPGHSKACLRVLSIHRAKSSHIFSGDVDT